MSTHTKINATCRNCGKTHGTDCWTSIDISENPELKEKVSSGEIFVWECPDCGTKNLFRGPLLYTDPVEKVILCLSEQYISADGEIPGFTARQTASAGEFLEKMKIFDAGLDDIAVEMCKFVTASELGKDVDLKFFRIDGPDHEITFTYPENGQMQMLELGFNVYEDCAAIVRRNPVLSEKAKGLVKVDQAWISDFLK